MSSSEQSCSSLLHYLRSWGRSWLGRSTLGNFVFVNKVDVLGKKGISSHEIKGIARITNLLNIFRVENFEWVVRTCIIKSFINLC